MQGWEGRSRDKWQARTGSQSLRRQLGRHAQSHYNREVTQHPEDFKLLFYNFSQPTQHQHCYRSLSLNWTLFRCALQSAMVSVPAERRSRKQRVSHISNGGEIKSGSFYIDLQNRKRNSPVWERDPTRGSCSYYVWQKPDWRNSLDKDRITLE